MELKYCEDCGDVVQLETEEPSSLSERFICGNCKAGNPAARAAATASPESRSDGTVPESWMKGTQVNLFSQRTISRRKTALETQAQAEKPKSKRLRLVKNETEECPPAEQAEECGSSVPSKEARKILFRCLHCRSPLSIRPVDKASKLTCPQCQNVIYISASGRLLKSSPSTAIRKQEEGSPIAEGSAGLLQEDIQKQSSRRHSPALPPLSNQQAPTLRISKSWRAEGEPANAVIGISGSSRVTRPVAATREKDEAGMPLPEPIRLHRPGSSASQRRSKPTSAFEEHRARQDPEKTSFLTEEPTTSLGEVAWNESLVPTGEKSGSARRFSPGVESSLSAPVPGARRPSTSPPGAAECAYPARASILRGNGRVAPVSSDSPRFLHILVLLICLMAPPIFTCVLLGRSLQAEGGTSPEPWSTTLFEQLGEIATKGVRHILGTP